MPLPNTPFTGLYQPIYPLGRTWKRRRYATTVLAGHFSKPSGGASKVSAPPLEERAQNIATAAVGQDSAESIPFSTSVAKEPLKNEIKATKRREPVLRGGTATPASDSTHISAPKPLARSSSTNSIPKLKIKPPVARGSNRPPVAPAVEAPKKAKLNAPPNPSPLSHPSLIVISKPSAATKGSGKRPAAADVHAHDDARPPKKARASAPPRGPASSTTYDGTEDVDELIDDFDSSPMYPTLSLGVPELTKAGTTVDGSASPSPKTLLHPPIDFLSASPPPSRLSSSHLKEMLTNDIDELDPLLAIEPEVPIHSPKQPKKREKVKKGWKGWIEVETDAVAESPLLIKIDEPVVLPKTRQTRSGRHFAALKTAETTPESSPEPTAESVVPTAPEDGPDGNLGGEIPASSTIASSE
ncbi:hypothetical protein DL93DRAFT_2163370 [Clavulina sp. PMI_390]|nr:hypothetical protein DL93DRAFT_2163370 [Clavulina sp. PMI_390]